MSEPRATPPGAWRPERDPITPSAGHAAVVVVSIALAAALIAGSNAIGGGGLLTRLVLLMGCFGLVVPVTVGVTVWRQARRLVRALLALAGVTCALLLVLAVTRLVTATPTLTAF